MPMVLVYVLLIGFSAGIAGGIFGLGGGAIMVPALVLLLGVDQKLASGTSLAAQILPIGLFGAIVYYRSNNLNIKYAVLLAIGLVAGNAIGAVFANQPNISSEAVKRAYGVFLLLIGARYLFWR